MPTREVFVQLWPPLVTLALLLGGLEFILRKTHWLSSFEAKTGGRMASLDGLRAFLAFGVVVCHVGTLYYSGHGMPWGPHPNPYYRQAGAASVRLFFMITGYLFWSKAIAGRGRLAVGKLYRNRLYRIMPLYVLLVAAIVAVAAVQASFRFAEPPGRVAVEVGGLIVPGFQTEGLVNGLDYTEFVRQAWTLKWEIVFYALLPLMAFGARSIAAFSGLAVVLVVVTAFASRHVAALDLSITLNFLVGMAAAHLRAWRPEWGFARSRAASAIVLAIAAAAPFAIARVSPYLGNLMYAALFVFVVYGTDLFGLLTTRSARVLGEVSYSVYLLHMLVLVLFVRSLERSHPIAGMSHEAFWLAATIPIIGILGLSFLTFRYVERWGIARGHRKPTVA